MAEADRLCDRIAIVDHGEIIALDTPRGLRRLLPGARGLEVTVTGAADPRRRSPRSARVEVAGTSPSGRAEVRVYGEAPLAALVAAADAPGLQVLELRRIEGTLEDVFVHLTGRDLR